MSAVAGTFVKFDAVATRKVVRLTVEAPIEKADEILRQLGGFPDPANAQWVGIAPLESEPKANTLKGGKLAQSAGIMCGEKGFWQFSKTSSAIEAADYLKRECRISSRAHLDHDDDAALIFREIKRSYDAWLSAG